MTLSDQKTLKMPGKKSAMNIFGSKNKKRTERNSKSHYSTSLYQWTGNGSDKQKGRGDVSLFNTWTNELQKDRYNRERGLKRLEKKVTSGRLTKANINNRGYKQILENGRRGNNKH